MKAGCTRVAIVIPVHNRRETTIRCLKSLSRIDASDGELRVFIVDAGSTDDTSGAIALQFPDVMVIPVDETLHYAAATNRGIAAALEWNAEFVLAMNDDAVVHDQFLRRLLATARAHPRSIVGALLLLWDQPHKVFQVGQRWATWKGGCQIPNSLTAFDVPSSPFSVECIVGNCVLFPADAIRECGLMDQDHFPYGWGDAQYLVRMRRAGWTLLIEPRAYVWCEPNTYPSPLHTRSVADVLRTLLLDQRSPQNLRRQFVARWYSAPSQAAAVAAFGVYLFTLVAKAVGVGRAKEDPQR